MRTHRPRSKPAAILLTATLGVFASCEEPSTAVPVQQTQHKPAKQVRERARLLPGEYYALRLFIPCAGECPQWEFYPATDATRKVIHGAPGCELHEALMRLGGQDAFITLDSPRLRTTDAATIPLFTVHLEQAHNPATIHWTLGDPGATDADRRRIARDNMWVRILKAEEWSPPIKCAEL